jgi:hypothetical protein
MGVTGTRKGEYRRPFIPQIKDTFTETMRNNDTHRRHICIAVTQVVDSIST